MTSGSGTISDSPLSRRHIIYGIEMTTRLNPHTVRAVPEKFKGIYAHAVEAARPARFLFASGQIGVDPNGLPAACFTAQCHLAMDNVEAILSQADMTRSDICRVVYYLTSEDHLEALTRIRQARWSSEQPPAVTTLVVKALAVPDLLVEIEVTAAR